MGLTISYIGGLCPTQADGAFDGNPFYFRARHGEWELAVCLPDQNPVDASLGWIPALYHAEGDDPSNGYMEAEAVTELLNQEYAKFELLYGGIKNAIN